MGLGILTSRLQPANPGGWLLINIGLYYMFGAVLVLPHECGHAFIAGILGFRVFWISLGAGRPLFRKRVGGTLLEFRPLPFGGSTAFGPRNGALLRTKIFLTILAGPLANLVVVILAFILIRPKHFAIGSIVASTTPFIDFTLSSAFILLWNLLPRSRPSVRGVQDSDGLALLKAFTVSPERREELLSSTYSLEGWLCLEEARYSDALSWYERGLKEHPRSTILRNDLGVAQLNLGQFEQARDSFLEVLRDDTLKPNVRALALNNVAASDLYLVPLRRELLEEADRLSEESFRLLGWAPVIKGTRGAVLIERGRVEEGLSLAKQAFETNESARSRAINACALAIGLHTQGKTGEAKQYLEIAHSLDPRSISLPRTREKMAGPLS